MGNKIYVDNKSTELDEILNSDLNLLKNSSDLSNSNLENESNENIKNIKNLKIWRFYENNSQTEEKVFSQSINLTKIKEDHFLFDSFEAYIILIIQKSKDQSEDLTIFPNSLWGIVKSSSNLTPRGLKYAFASCSENEINLESYLISKRNFKDSEYKYNLFIWNGKNSSPFVRSNSLMKAFDLDKKLSTAEILPYLYKGFLFENSKILKNKVTNLNQIIENNKLDNHNEELNTPTTESMRNYQENVYLLQILYPKKIKKVKQIKDQSSRTIKKLILFPKIVKNFINPKHKINYYDNFVSLDSIATLPNSKRSQSKDKNFETFSLRNKKDDFFPNNNYENEDNLISSEYEEDDLNDDLYFEESDNIGMLSKLSKIGSNPLSFKKENFSLENSNKKVLFKNVGNIKNFPNGGNFKEKEKEFSLSSSRNDNSSNRQQANLNEENLSKTSRSNKNFNDDDSSSISQRSNKNKENNIQNKQKDIKVPNDNNNITNKNICKDLKIPKLIMGVQKKIINDEEITEDNFDNLPDSIIKKSSDKIFNLNLNLINLEKNNKNKKMENNKINNINFGKLNINRINENNNIPDDDRKNMVIDFFSKSISEIIEGFIYISNYAVAKNKELIEENKITHIINASSDNCLNHFNEEGIVYLNYYLKDHPIEVKFLFINLLEYRMFVSRGY